MTLKEEDIQFIIDLAGKAGRRAHSMRESITISEKSGPNDKVTSADIELSKMITEALKDRFPDDTVISEEDKSHEFDPTAERIWMIDPIDGTSNYINTRSQYSVMIGLLVSGAPVFGFVYAPAEAACYFGGPDKGAWKLFNGQLHDMGKPDRLEDTGEYRLMMGSRDRKRFPWVERLDTVRLVNSGSVGVKVARIIEDKADIFVHLSGKLKAWDTAGPTAIALGAGLEVGTLEDDTLSFELPSVLHESSVIIGRPGCLAWCRSNLSIPQ